MRHSISTLTSTLVFCAASVMTSSAMAGDLYGAIAYSLEEGVHGYAVNYDSQAEAEEAALDSCVEELEHEGNECGIELWFKNAYAALAEGENGFGTGWGRYKQDAQLEALNVCQKHTTDCDISLTVGTD